MTIILTIQTRRDGAVQDHVAGSEAPATVPSS
jgi:hypothetical protein